jgi:hypothetical protein
VFAPRKRDARAAVCDAAAGGRADRQLARGYRLGAGCRELTLVATLPGVPLYLSFGFEPIDELEVELPDGVRIDCVSMAKPIAAL